MNEHIVGVIPARYGSTRLPGKSLIILAGKPLIEWVWEAAGKSQLLAELLIATDDERIGEVCSRFGATVVMTSVDCPSGSDRIAEALIGRPGDIVVNLQGDEPLMNSDTLDACIQALIEDPRADVCSAMTALDREEDFRNPNVVKVVTDLHGYAMYFSRSSIPDVSRCEAGEWLDGRPMKHLGLYVYRRAALERFISMEPSRYERVERLEQLRFLEAGCRIRMVEVTEEGIGVDTLEDARRAEALLLQG